MSSWRNDGDIGLSIYVPIFNQGDFLSLKSFNGVSWELGVSKTQVFQKTPKNFSGTSSVFQGCLRKI